METAPAWHVGRTRRFTGQHRPLREPIRRVRLRHRVQKSLRVWVQRILDQLRRRPLFHDAAQVHDCRRWREMPRRRDVMRDVEIADAMTFLQFAQQRQYLGAARRVDHRDRLIGKDVLRCQR